MNLGLVFAHLVLAVVGFLISLNGQLRGAKKSQIDSVLSMVLLITLGIVAWQFGWLAAVTALFMAFVYVALAKPIAARVSSRLLGYWTAYENPGGAPIYTSAEDLLCRGDETEFKVQQLAKKPGVAKVLQERGMTTDDLVEQFWFLQRIGVGNLAWDVISDPDDLKMLLDLRDQELPPLVIASRMIR